MRYKNIEKEWNEDWLNYDGADYYKGNIAIAANDELIDIVNKIRKDKGYTDLVEIDINNEVYYEFYLIFDVKEQKINLESVVNNSEQDDWTTYDLPTTNIEEKHLLYKITEWLLEEIYNY